MDELRIFARAIRLGRWRMARMTLAKWWYGLTHRTCRKCGGPKELNVRFNCWKCQYDNLMRALFDESEDAGEDFTERERRTRMP